MSLLNCLISNTLLPDFGTAGFGIGQINLRAHDPGPAGLNYTCDDIIANYVSLTAPAPVTVLSLLYVSFDSPATQITAKIVLNDFEFFQEELTFGDTGTDTVREFTGGLSPYGFFEPEATVYRGPAGVDTLDNSGQKLQYGMFGIFY